MTECGPGFACAAAILTGSEPDRNGIAGTQGTDQAHRCRRLRTPPQRHRRSQQPLHARRMPQLLSRCGTQSNVSAKCLVSCSMNRPGSCGGSGSPEGAWIVSRATKGFSPDLCGRAVPVAGGHWSDRASDRAALTPIAGKIGCTAAGPRRWWCREEARRRSAPAARLSGDRTRLKFPGRDVNEPRRTNRVLRKASAYPAQAELDRCDRGGWGSSGRHKAREKDDNRRRQRPGTVPARQGQPRVQGHTTRRVGGCRLHPRPRPGRVCLCRIRHRRRCPAQGWLAGRHIGNGRLGARCARAGDPRPPSRCRRWFDPSQRPGQRPGRAIADHERHPAPRQG